MVRLTKSYVEARVSRVNSERCNRPIMDVLWTLSASPSIFSPSRILPINFRWLMTSSMCSRVGVSAPAMAWGILISFAEGLSHHHGIQAESVVQLVLLGGCGASAGEAVAIGTSAS